MALLLVPPPLLLGVFGACFALGIASSSWSSPLAAPCSSSSSPLLLLLALTLLWLLGFATLRLCATLWPRPPRPAEEEAAGGARERKCWQWLLKFDGRI